MHRPRYMSAGSHSLIFLSTKSFPMSRPTTVLVMEAMPYSVSSVAGIL